MTAVSTNAQTESTDHRAWISTSFHGELEAKFYDNVSKVVLQDGARNLSIHLDPAAAMRLAFDLVAAVAHSGETVPTAMADALVWLESAVHCTNGIRPRVNFEDTSTGRAYLAAKAQP